MPKGLPLPACPPGKKNQSTGLQSRLGEEDLPMCVRALYFGPVRSGPAPGAREDPKRRRRRTIRRRSNRDLLESKQEKGE
jgi:hypothetical protein